MNGNKGIMYISDLLNDNDEFFDIKMNCSQNTT